MATTGRRWHGAMTLALLGGLAACDGIGNLGAAGAPRARELDTFGTATRERPAGGPEGRFEVVITSTRDATWADAMVAMGLQSALECDDGAPFAVLGQEPRPPRGLPPGTPPATYPAGTVFRVVIRCRPDYPRTEAYPHDAPWDAAAKRARQALAPATAPDDGVVNLRHGAYNERIRKYDAVSRAMGGLVLEHGARCAGRGGVVIHDRVLVEQDADPDPPLGPRLATRRFVLAARLDCAGAATPP